MRRGQFAGQRDLALARGDVVVRSHQACSSHQSDPRPHLLQEPFSTVDWGAPLAGPAGAPLPPLLPLLWYFVHCCA